VCDAYERFCILTHNLYIRFDGAVPEPRKGIRSGHVPGSKCVPFPQVEICNYLVSFERDALVKHAMLLFSVCVYKYGNGYLLYKFHSWRSIFYVIYYTILFILNIVC
jgi:hypothetical protein